MIKFKNPFKKQYSPSLELQAYRDRKAYWLAQGLNYGQAGDVAHQELYGRGWGRYPLGGLEFGWYPVEEGDGWPGWDSV